MAMASAKAVPIPHKNEGIFINQKNGHDKARGRRRNRMQSDHDEIDKSALADEKEAQSSGGDAEPQDGPRKRRRSRKGLDKKFECPHEDCDKSYSRAEHLSRHQLNHTPKQIYVCDYPGFPKCGREFVRQDLCNRHRERHTAKGSQLQRKHSILNISPASASDIKSETAGSPTFPRPNMLSSSMESQQTQQLLPSNGHTRQSGELNTATFAVNHTGALPQAHQGGNAFWKNSPFPEKDMNLDEIPFHPQKQRQPSMARGGPGEQFDHNSLAGARNDGSVPHSVVPILNNYMPKQQQQQHHMYGDYRHQGDGSWAVGSTPFINTQNLPPFALPPPGMSPMGPTATHPGAASLAYTGLSSPHDALSVDYKMEDANLDQASVEMMLLDASNTMAVFGNEDFESNRSPFAGREDEMTAWLFGGQQQQQYGGPGMNLMDNGLSYGNSQNSPHAIIGNDFGFFPDSHQHPMAVTSILDPSMPLLTEERSREIVDFIREKFNEKDLVKPKEYFLEGDHSDDSHMMSRKMMQTYMDNFWWHFHPQLPMLHKPTFSPEKAPKLLLIAIMAIGASCLDKFYGVNLTRSCAEFANFLAWHLRWEIFSHAHARPPAKLWVFQALILLEIYEKLFSTRALHERAHLHHAFTITLMRRGSSLTGRTADSPPSARESKPGTNGSRQSSTSGVNTPDEKWNQWITNEATHRAAWAAFVIDSVHATMFGHNTTMIAYEMLHVPLPCDETLWSATTSAEVYRVEAGLRADGYKPSNFAESLQNVVKSEEVRTNAFGRTIIMAGLLSLGWHMKQRDEQYSSLRGLEPLLKDKWKGIITRSFDNWRNDFDRSLAQSKQPPPGPYPWSVRQDKDIVFESRTVLSHLAHMAMHVEIVDCQILARAPRLLGRSITERDLNRVTRKMKDKWVSTAHARDATYYAIQFLCEVLLQKDTSSTQPYHHQPDHIGYSARDDVLMNRSWVLYFAALVVWSYAFSLEGPCLSRPLSDDPQEQVQSMRNYLERMRRVKTPDELVRVTGFNECAGMLQVIRQTFSTTRWELLQEAANLLRNCIKLISGQSVPTA